MSVKEWFIGSTTEKVTNSMRVLNEMVAQTLISNTQECSASGIVEQRMETKCPSPEQMAAIDNSSACRSCQSSWGFRYGSRSCDSVCASCNAKNLSQKATVHLSTNCQVSAAMVQKMQVDLENALTQQASKKEDALGKMLSSLTSGGDDSETTNNMTIENIVRNLITMETVQRMITAVQTKQEMIVGGANAEGLYQETAVVAIQESLQKNSATSETIARVENQLAQSIVKETQGLFDWIGNVMIVAVVVLGVIGGGIIFVRSGQALKTVDKVADKTDVNAALRDAAAVARR